ncbi:SDR family NAD(P)-dependent oxidoreductase, partial [Streptomyces sp. NPDC059037]|uniref:SDR family NAD(P)-dependent oxidoreductase n=1 Tax=Streptomyces sp. NPDC059037 TaxID=3346710 RepID=UPI00368CF802
MESKVALVTGAAGGIGSAVARALAEDGMAVAAVDRDAEGLDNVVRKLTADGLVAEAFPADITDRAEGGPRGGRGGGRRGPRGHPRHRGLINKRSRRPPRQCIY